jgi:ATP-dependent Clp protease ATP-binding subunit ClpC
MKGELGPVIGRRQELLRLLQTLARQSKNNPVLVGEAGVGKTAIVEALAIRAAAGKDRAVLGSKRFVEVNMGNLLAGAKYRGQFEERLSGIVAAAKQDPNLVIFIDEIHTVMGAGRSGDEGLDAANMLKPALARGELRCIGATTPTEYRRYVESDPALERRFEKVLVPEPTREETIEILRGLRPKWEEHHGVRILDDALEAAVDLSLRFDTEHRLPDKAIDLVDKAAARTRVPVLSMMAPEEGSGGAGGAAVFGDVTEEAVAYVLAEKRGVPPERVLDGLESKAASRLLELDEFLEERLIGQEEAVLRVGQRLRLAHSGIKTRRGPMAVFLFLGPTGVGKTEMARLLTEFLFGSASDLVRFDMSEYMDEHSVSKLIGAPPGYVGHEDEGRLTFHLTRKPYSVVLLDEIEKAHARVFDLFLQVFDEGRLTDSKGRAADARHAVFVMTSNLGASRKSPGFGGSDEGAIRPDVRVEEAQQFFRPELWNRIDEVIVFRHLEENHALRILRPWIRALAERLREQHGVGLTVTPEAEAFLVRSGYSAALGARELQRTVERLLQVPLSNLILSGKIQGHPEWQLVYEEGGVYLLPRTA